MKTRIRSRKKLVCVSRSKCKSSRERRKSTAILKKNKH